MPGVVGEGEVGGGRYGRDVSDVTRDLLRVEIHGFGRDVGTATAK